MILWHQKRTLVYYFYNRYFRGCIYSAKIWADSLIPICFFFCFLLSLIHNQNYVVISNLGIDYKKRT